MSGLLRSCEFAKACFYLRTLPETEEKVVQGFLEADWERHLDQLRLQGEFYDKKRTILIRVSGSLIDSLDSFAAWVSEVTGQVEIVTDEQVTQLAEEEYVRTLTETKCKYVCWEVTIGEGNPRKVVLQLDHQLCPKTVSSFWQLACGNGFLQYKGSFFHRVVEDGYIEGGLLKTTSGRRANCAVSGEMFLDENYAYKHDRPGVIGLSRSVPARNGSAFYITLRAIDALDTKNVAFGRVIEGMEVIYDIAHQPSKNQRPLVSCKIVKSIPYLQPDGKLFKVADSPGSESRPRSQMEHTRTLSKLESADIDTLTQRREAIVKDLEKTQEELEEQESLLDLVLEILRQRE